MIEYIEVDPEIYDNYNFYQRGENILSVVKTLDGRFVTSPNSIEIFSDVLTKDYTIINLSIDDFPQIENQIELWISLDNQN